ncbi:response regulator [Methanobrevibacter acididurans]|uniref:response regulator n=1 Tax=Methanobrevibacter acididurans TaxID=120963 RepID=UPI0038FCC150
MNLEKILIVEDETLSATDLKYKLEDLGYEVISIVDNGDDAIYTAVHQRPDLVLMDIGLKGEVDCISASQKILALDIPVVFITANINDENFKEVNIKPPYGFITKPFNVKNLERVIKIAIKRSKIEVKKADLARGIVKNEESNDGVDSQIDLKAEMEYHEGLKFKDRDENVLKAVDDPVKLIQNKPDNIYSILIVEDEAITALDLKGNLEKSGYHITDIVDNAEDAIKSAKENPPYLVLLDINLKGEKSGISIAEEINLLSIPIVYLTAQTDDATSNEAIETAPYAYVTKPFNKRDLEYTIALAINKSLNNMGQIYKVEDKVKEKNVEMKIEKINVLVIFGGSLILIIAGLLSRNVTWLEWVLFIPSAIMVFLAVASMFKQDPVKEWDVNPFVTLLVPAHNEEFTIRECVDSLANIDYTLNGEKNYELIVINDGSEDNTGGVLNQLKDEYDCLNVVTRVPPRSGKGKGFVLNDGLEISKGSIIAVFDADARVEPDFLNIIIPYLNDDKIQGVQSRIKMYNKDENFLTRMQHVELAGFGNIVRAKDILGKAGFLGGNGQLVKKEAIVNSEGWDGFAITEDLNLSVKLMINGYAIRYCGDTWVYQEAVPTWRQLFRQRSRWAIGNFETLFIYSSKIINSPMPVFRMFGVLEHVAFYGLNMLVFFGFIVFIVNIVAWLGFGHSVFIRMDAPLIVGVISAFGFFPSAFITLSRDRVSLPRTLLDVVGYWIYCFHLIPLFFMTFWQMLTRKERTWAKTVHTGDEEDSDAECIEENIDVGKIEVEK